jgi:hypothetical protein
LAVVSLHGHNVTSGSAIDSSPAPSALQRALPAARTLFVANPHSPLCASDRHSRRSPDGTDARKSRPRSVPGLRVDVPGFSAPRKPKRAEKTGKEQSSSPVAFRRKQETFDQPRH